MNVCFGLAWKLKRSEIVVKGEEQRKKISKRDCMTVNYNRNGKKNTKLFFRKRQKQFLSLLFRLTLTFWLWLYIVKKSFSIEKISNSGKERTKLSYYFYKVCFSLQFHNSEASYLECFCQRLLNDWIFFVNEGEIWTEWKIMT